MKRPFPAYHGNEPFVFISYSHRDSEDVFREITWLREQGFNIWYDEGIEAGKEWRDEIATAISNSSILVYFVTPNSVGSENCRNEVNFAADEQTPILTVYLESTELPGGLRLTLSNRQAINRFDLSEDEYTHKFIHCLAGYTGVTSDSDAEPQVLSQIARQTRGQKTDQSVKEFTLKKVALWLGVILIPVSVWFAFWLQPYQVSGPTDVDIVQTESRLRSIAVLPFQNLNQATTYETVADGIALDLVNGLSKIHDIRVAAGTSSFAFKDQYLDVSDIGKQLKVDTVLEGSVRIVDDTARVTAQLLLVEDGYQLWSERYDITFSHVLDLQDQVTAQILDSVRLHLIDKSAFESSETVLGAYNLYLVARDNMRARTEDSLILAKAQFEESLALDPSYAPAWADLARVLVLLSDLQYGEVPFIEAKVIAQENLAKAFSLEPNLASAYATQGFLLRNEGKQMEALSSFHRAIAADVNNAYAHFMISEVLAETGNFNGSLEELEIAYKLDNRHPIIQYRLVMYYLAIENFDSLKAIIRPDQALLTQSLIDFRLGNEAAGVKTATEYLKLEESGFAGVHLRLELARRYYYRLKNLDQAQQTVSETSAFSGRVYFQALDYPEVAYQLLRRIPDDYHGRFSRYLLARSQILTGRFEACLESLDYQGVENIVIQGSIFLGLPGSELSLAFFQSFCLSRLGRQDEAMAIQKELVRYHQLAIAQGEPPGYFRHIARLEVLAGNYDHAVSLLEQAFDNHYLDWTDLANPWFDELRPSPKFQTLQTSVYEKMNRERGKLGWEPVKPQLDEQR